MFKGTILILFLCLSFAISQDIETPVKNLTLTIYKGNSQLGAFLEDQDGFPLYINNNDLANISNCYGECTTLFKPLLQDSSTRYLAPAGVDHSIVKTFKRRDGTDQVTYYNFPLYKYENDRYAHQTSGQGYNSTWYLLSPRGFPIYNSTTMESTTSFLIR